VKASLRDVASVLAEAFMDGTWHVRTLMARGDAALGTGGDWLRELAFSVVQYWRDAPPAQPQLLTDFIATNEFFTRAWREKKLPRRLRRYALAHPTMGARRWEVPALDTVGDVAAWLELSPAELTWLSDRRGLERVSASEALRHYRRTWIPRGERLPRLLEAPKDRLKRVQRKILDEVLTPIPPHEAAHGFVPGRSVITHATMHAGQAWVMRFDLEAFFTNVSTWRALHVFRAAGYPEEVSTILLGLCTTRTPERVLREAPWVEKLPSERFFLQRRLAEWHLPQGAPTSPALANLAAFTLDVRLSALAGAKELHYSRYADDLVFSGRRCSVATLLQQVRAIARDEGFRLNVGKTRVMRAHEQQRVTGVVVNQKPNISREEFDSLKALLHRCAQRGPLSQSTGPLAEFRATLQGKISWVAQLSATRGAKLQQKFDALDWTE
jgi:hypothetical protein